MGEYVWAKITIRGHIPSIEAFNDLLDALEGKALKVDGADDGDRESLMAEFAAALTKGHDLAFSDNEINYGDLSEITSVCQHYGIGYEHDYDGAGGEEGGSSVWYPGEEKAYDDNDCVLDAHKLEKLLAEEDPLAAIRARLAFMKRASGMDLPELSVSDEVRDHLAVEIARARIAA